MPSVDTIFTGLFCAVILYGAVLHYRYWSAENPGVSLNIRHRKIVSGGLCTVSVLTWFVWADVYLYYCRTYSNIPNPELGRTYPLINHGQIEYVTLAQRNGLIITAIVCGVLFLAGYLLARSVENADISADTEESVGE